MQITALKVDGFGVWSNLELEGLGGGLNVVYGPNEAGKTTLVHFIRSVLYGFSEARRQRYLPPVYGGPAGGTIGIQAAQGRFHLARRPDPEGSHIGRVSVTAQDGMRYGDEMLTSVLSQVDESIFTNVFAISLTELQELSALGDTEAAQLLYRLTTGLDRISLVDVMRELGTSRRQLLNSTATGGTLVELVERRNRLKRDLATVHDAEKNYADLFRQRESIDREAEASQRLLSARKSELKQLDVAARLRDSWLKVSGIEKQLSGLGPMPDLPPGTLDRLEDVLSRLGRRRGQLATCKQQFGLVRDEVRRLPVNETLWRESPRIEALSDSHDWIATLSGQIKGLESERAALDSQQGETRAQLGLSSSHTPNLGEGWLAPLRPLARAVREARSRLDEASQQLDQLRKSADSAQSRVRGALAKRNVKDLDTALSRASEQVTNLRRRVQLDERVAQLESTRNQVANDDVEALEAQLPDLRIIIGLGSLFSLCAMLVLSTTSSATTFSFGWGLAVVGALGCLGPVLAKRYFEKTAREKHETCQKQLGMLEAQIRQAKEEREAMDKQLSKGGGPFTARLQAAEKQLAELEQLVPLESKRQVTSQDLDLALERAESAENDLARAQSRWREGLHRLGLPEDLEPKQIREIATHYNDFGDRARRIGRLDQDLEGRRATLLSLSSRIAEQFRIIGLAPRSSDPLQQLAQLREAVAEHRELVRKRDGLKRKATKIRKSGRKLKRSIRSLVHERQGLLQLASIRDESQLKQLTERYSTGRELAARRDELRRHLQASLDGVCSEEELVATLDEYDQQQLDERRAALRAEVQGTEDSHGQLFVRKGQLDEKLAALRNDRQDGKLKLELASVQQRIQTALGRWQTLALATKLLDTVRQAYERDRQPEVLQKASVYLGRMTEGQYVRVWTPLDDDTLFVDTAEGETLTPQQLSRGTREQLFLCLRLGLAAHYAKRGIRLPLVMDDLLVNFDTGRARAAAALLCDFAREGHQVLVFTCHEHIVEIFEALEVPVRQLPRHGQSLPAAPATKPAELPKAEPISPSAPDPAPTAEAVEPEEQEPEPEPIPTKPATKRRIRSRRKKRPRVPTEPVVAERQPAPPVQPQETEQELVSIPMRESSDWSDDDEAWDEDDDLLTGEGVELGIGLGKEDNYKLAELGEAHREDSPELEPVSQTSGEPIAVDGYEDDLGVDEYDPQAEPYEVGEVEGTDEESYEELDASDEDETEDDELAEDDAEDGEEASDEYDDESDEAAEYEEYEYEEYEYEDEEEDEEQDADEAVAEADADDQESTEDDEVEDELASDEQAEDDSEYEYEYVYEEYDEEEDETEGKSSSDDDATAA